MGNYLNKLNPNSSTASGSDDDGPSGIVKSAVVALVGMLMLSAVLSGGALADTITGISSTDIGSGDTTQFVMLDIDGADYTVGQTETVYVNASGVDYTSATAVETASGDFEVQSTNYNSTSEEFEIVVNKTATSPDNSLQFEVSNYSVTSDGTDGQVYTTSNGTTYTDSFNYSTSTTSEPATGSIEIPSVTENDTGNETNFSYEVVNSNDTVVASGSDVSAPVTESNLTTGDYTVNINGVDNYDNLSKTVSVTENNTSSVNFSLSRTTVDYEFTVENNGSAAESFDINLYDGSSIGDSESAVASATVTSTDSNTVTFTGLDDGADYTAEIVYTDADGNETTYTETFTADSSQATNGTVSQTIDVATDSSSDDSGFIGGVSNPFDGVFDSITDQLPSDPVELVLVIVSGFVGLVGILFTLLWVKNGLKYSNL
jgi:hypothetical protein